MLKVNNCVGNNRNKRVKTERFKTNKNEKYQRITS